MESRRKDVFLSLGTKSQFFLYGTITLMRVCVHICVCASAFHLQTKRTEDS